jgi:hypothetical protein
MRKLMTMALAVTALCGMTAFAQTAPSPATTSPMPGTPPEQEHIMRAHRDAELLHRAIMEGMHDPATLQLVTQALTDRTTQLQADLNRVTQLQALVTAIQGGNKAAIQAARETVKTATEAVITDAKTFSEDCRAIREHLQSLPHPGRRLPPGTGATPAGTNP